MGFFFGPLNVHATEGLKLDSRFLIVAAATATATTIVAAAARESWPNRACWDLET